MQKNSSAIVSFKNAFLFRNFKARKGILFQKSDSESTIRKRLRGSEDCERASRYCKQHKVAIQAGGHSGLYPLALSKIFESVYTFEPDHDNFLSLALNTAQNSNIYKLQAALGRSPQFIDLNRKSGGSGSHYVDGNGMIPMLTVDICEFEACDLIYFDIEGFEHEALMGAERTIQRFRPVIVLEDKGHAERFGVPSSEAVDHLVERHHYDVAARSNKDVILTPADLS